jgi:hypothetical protein
MGPRWALNAVVAVVAIACLAWLAPPQARADAAQSLAGSLQNDPVQILGTSQSAYSAMSSKQVAGLRAEIARLDPGRIFIAFLSPRNQSALEEISNSAFADLPAGTLISIADDPQNARTTHFFVGSTWEDNGTAQNELNDVIQRYHSGQGPLSADLRLAIQSFARADAAAGHPAPASSGAGTAAAPQRQPASPTSSDGGISGGVITGIIAVAVLLLIAAIPVTRAIRSGMGASHWHKEQAADAHTHANSDFVKLGEAIEALDIDSSMPNASAAGKDEYSHAIGCYAEAERQLKQADDPYHFDRALAAIKAGHRHVQAADQLFNPAKQGAPSLDETALVDRLEKLTTLHDSGALTDAEFSAQKHKLLGN